MFLEKLFGNGYSYTLVYAFSYFSHLLYDMLTKQGVPLFYPFRRNPCVIPGNPDMRLRSSDLKTEAACFAIFILLGITCQNLFANGFWNTYNRQFSDLKHLHQEAQMSETLLSVVFKFRNEAGKDIAGTGLLIKSYETEAVIWEKDHFVKIEKLDKIQSLIPTRTQKMLVTEDVFFSNISPDSLTTLLHGKAITALTLQSNTEFAYTKENKPETGKRAELTYVVNPKFDFAKAIAEAKEDTISGRKKILEYELRKELARQAKLHAEKQQLSASIKRLSDSIRSMELYDREKATKELAALKQDLANFKEIEDNAGKIRLQIQTLDKKIIIVPEATLINGYLNFIKL